MVVLTDRPTRTSGGGGEMRFVGGLLSTRGSRFRIHICCGVGNAFLHFERVSAGDVLGERRLSPWSKVLGAGRLSDDAV